MRSQIQQDDQGRHSVDHQRQAVVRFGRHAGNRIIIRAICGEINETQRIGETGGEERDVCDGAAKEVWASHLQGLSRRRCILEMGASIARVNSVLYKGA